MAIFKAEMSLTVMLEADSADEATNILRAHLEQGTLEHSLDDGYLIGVFTIGTPSKVAKRSVRRELELLDNDGSFFG